MTGTWLFRSVADFWLIWLCCLGHMTVIPGCEVFYSSEADMSMFLRSGHCHDMSTRYHNHVIRDHMIVMPD